MVLCTHKSEQDLFNDGCMFDVQQSHLCSFGNLRSGRFDGQPLLLLEHADDPEPIFDDERDRGGNCVVTIILGSDVKKKRLSPSSSRSVEEE